MTMADELLAQASDINGKVDTLLECKRELQQVLEMVRDADEDCKRDGLQTIPPIARAKIDAALAKAEKLP